MKIKINKSDSGITLIALIITIIVLLILAVVAINAVQDDGIIEYAKNARYTYQNAQTNESTLLGGYLDQIEQIEEEIATVKIIRFQIEGIEGEFEAKEGMTFGEWVNSGYNKIGAVLEKDDDGNLIKVVNNGAEKWVHFRRRDGIGGAGGIVESDDKIHDYSENTKDRYIKYYVVIKFEIEGIEGELEAKEGMTFGEWVNSGYNTIGAVLEKDDNYDNDLIKVAINGEEQWIWTESYNQSNMMGAPRIKTE